MSTHKCLVCYFIPLFCWEGGMIERLIGHLAVNYATTCHREKFFRSPLASHLSFPSPKMQQQFWREKLHTTISNLAISSLSYLRTLEWMPCSPSNLLLLILSVCFITPFTANFRHNCWVSNKKEFQWKNLPDFSTVNTDE